MTFTFSVANFLASPLLGAVSHLPPGDWRMGAPFFFTAALLAACAVIFKIRGQTS